MKEPRDRYRWPAHTHGTLAAARRLTAVLATAAVLAAGCSSPPLPTPEPRAPLTDEPGEPPPEPPAGGLTAREAVDIAREVATERAANARVTAGAVRYADTREMQVPHLEPQPAPDAWLWIVNLVDGPVGPLSGEGTIVVIDFFDGTVLGVTHWIA